MIGSIVSNVASLFKSVWSWVKKIFVQVLNFAKNIVEYFRNPARLKELQNNKDLVAIAIRQKQGENIQVVLNVFNAVKNKIIIQKPMLLKT